MTRTWHPCDPGCPGWGVFNENGEIQRCDECNRFADDDEAIQHVSHLMRQDARSLKLCVKCGVVITDPQLQGDERCATCGDGP